MAQQERPSYDKTTWEKGQVIAASQLNKLERAVEEIDNEINAARGATGHHEENLKQHLDNLIQVQEEEPESYNNKIWLQTGTIHEVEVPTLDEHNALSAGVDDLQSALTKTQDWIGYARNLIDCRDFAISNSTNWGLSATKTSLNIEHKTTYSSGFPIIAITLPSGTYKLIADFTNSAIKQLNLRVNGSWVKALENNTEFTIDSSNTNEIYFSSNVIANYSITDIGIVDTAPSGKIQEIESDITQITSDVSSVEQDIITLQTGFNDIADVTKSALTAADTLTNKTINSSGNLITAGVDTYKIDKFAVTAGKKYWLSGSANWGNLNWCFYGSDDAVIQTGDASASSATFTNISNEEVTAPVGASYVLVTYNTRQTAAKCETETSYHVAKWKGKKWVCVGDSLTAENIRTTKHYFDYVAEKTGITTVNMGVSGSGYARLSDESKAFYQRISSCPTDADVVTIFGSFNDLGAGLDIGTVNDTGTTTLAGCINTTIDNLQAVIPLVNLGIVAPTPWDTTQPSTSGNAYNYVEMLKAICERRSIPFLDLWRCSNLRPWDADFRALAYSKDGGSGTHPDESGHKLIAPRFEGFLDTLLLV